MHAVKRCQRSSHVVTEDAHNWEPVWKYPEGGLSTVAFSAMTARVA
jgi:hypothetical protein